jgi:hypothetical protein
MRSLVSRLWVLISSCGWWRKVVVGVRNLIGEQLGEKRHLQSAHVRGTRLGRYPLAVETKRTHMVILQQVRQGILLES